MATVKKGTFCVSPEWWKHLRPFVKRMVNKRERQAAKKEIKREEQT